MYMEKKFFIIVFAAMMAMAAFTACSDDDASRTMSGEEMLKNISMVIADQADTEKLYQVEEDAPDMILVADSKEAAHKLCERFISDQWDGKQRTVELPDNCGNVALAPATDESIFCTVSFTGLKSCDYPVFSIIIAPEEYLLGENFEPYTQPRKPILWICNDCGWWTDNKLDKETCKRCGSTNGRKPGPR